MKLTESDVCSACQLPLIGVRLFASYGMDMILPKESFWNRLRSRSILSAKWSDRNKNNALYCKNCGLIYTYVSEEKRLHMLQRLEKLKIK
ncbi:MAG: hypothetical protein IT244_03515 [Bacteroidia bacterium]|nr:hypothetical protein [Bacteroidia bacterium]